MRGAHVVEIETPDRYLLNGLWFGPARAQRVLIFVHGLTGSAFSMKRIVDRLVQPSTAVLTFNNRGFEEFTSVKRRVGRTTSYVSAGAGREIFTDSPDDIQGAINFAKQNGAREIYLVGHSTGAQKSIYWAAKGGRGVKGFILLGPLSDYSGALHEGGDFLPRGVRHAKKLIASRKPHELMPKHLRFWFECDAQRYISLYTKDSPENIFTYAFPKERPAMLERVKKPILVFIAGDDEFGDKSPTHISEWFLRHVYEGEVIVVPKVGHSFRGGEQEIVDGIARFMKET